MKIFRLILLLAALADPAYADEKAGMPDLAQIEQTCLPTSTANLIIWFGHHGYPRLIQPGATESDRDLNTVHRIMADTDARFDWGTQMSMITYGIERYIHEAGYDCDVEFRGLAGEKAFSEDWLKENDDPNKGFVLLLGYCHYDPGNNSFSNAFNAGHAVTLVNYEPDTLLIHDPAHENDEPGRKIVTPQTITQGTWQETGLKAPVAGLLLLSGSLLEAPDDSQVMLTGAVCITMHPVPGTGAPASPTPAAPTPVVAGTASPSTPASSPAGTSAHPSGGTWWTAILNWIFK